MIAENPNQVLHPLLSLNTITLNFVRKTFQILKIIFDLRNQGFVLIGSQPQRVRIVKQKFQP